MARFAAGTRWYASFSFWIPLSQGAPSLFSGRLGTQGVCWQVVRSETVGFGVAFWRFHVS